MAEEVGLEGRRSALDAEESVRGITIIMDLQQTDLTETDRLP